MEWIIWCGAALSILGLVGVIYCIVSAMKLRKRLGATEELRTALMKLLPVNLGALMLSILGLVAIVAGIFLSA